MLKDTVTLNQLSQMTPEEQYAFVLALAMEDILKPAKKSLTSGK